MWQRSFIAATVAIGGSVEDALAAISGAREARELGAAETDLVARLRGAARSTKAAAIGAALGEVAKGIAEVALR